MLALTTRVACQPAYQLFVGCALIVPDKVENANYCTAKFNQVQILSLLSNLRVATIRRFYKNMSDILKIPVPY